MLSLRTARNQHIERLEGSTQSLRLPRLPGPQQFLKFATPSETSHRIKSLGISLTRHDQAATDLQSAVPYNPLTAECG